jgi:hypothetical protein
MLELPLPVAIRFEDKMIVFAFSRKLSYFRENFKTLHISYKLDTKSAQKSKICGENYRFCNFAKTFAKISAIFLHFCEKAKAKISISTLNKDLPAKICQIWTVWECTQDVQVRLAKLGLMVFFCLHFSFSLFPLSSLLVAFPIYLLFLSIYFSFPSQRNP